MNNRPALAASFVIAGGIFSAKYFFIPTEVLTAFSALFFVLTIILFLLYRKEKGRNVLASPFPLLLLFAASALSYNLNEQFRYRSHITNFFGTDSLTMFCKVVDEPRTAEGKTKLLVDVLSLQNETDSLGVEGRAYLTIFADKRRNEQPEKISYGAFLQMKSLLQPPPDERNPGEFSYREYLKLNNIYALIFVRGYSNVQFIGTPKPNIFFQYAVFPVKDFITRTITTVMKGDEANFLIGLLLGDRTDISEEIKTAFMNTGTIHVLAVSGSHVILVVAIIYFLFGLLRIPLKLKIIATIAALIFYTYLTGATPSVVRASIMSIIVLLGKYFEQRIDGYNVLGLSAVIIFLFDPKQLFDVGFQLSFSAVFSLIYFYPKLKLLIEKIPDKYEEFKIISWLLKALAVSVAAQVGTIPFTAYYFGKVSIISFAANLFVVPLVELIVTIGLAGALLGVFSMWIASCFSEVNNYLALFTLNLVKLTNQIPYATVNTALFGWRETALYSIIVLWLFNLRDVLFQKKLIFASLIAANIFLFLSFAQSKNHPLRVTFLDVGQGDASVIQFPTGEVLVVDAGPITADFDAGEKTVAPFLLKNGITTITALLTSHPHADHLGGIPYLLKNFSVSETIDPNQKAESKLFQEYEHLKAATAQTSAEGGMRLLSLPNVRLYCFHPTEKFLDTDSSNRYSDLNESSVVFKLQYGTTSFLFTGDAEVPAEEHLSAVYKNFLKSDILKAGHHGSITSSSEIFLDYVQPKEVVVSVGKFNKFKHPSKVVLERYRQRKIRIRRTDEEGAVIFESNGETISTVLWK